MTFYYHTRKYILGLHLFQHRTLPGLVKLNSKMLQKKPKQICCIPLGLRSRVLYRRQPLPRYPRPTRTAGDTWRLELPIWCCINWHPDKHREVLHQPLYNIRPMYHTLAHHYAGVCRHKLSGLKKYILVDEGCLIETSRFPIIILFYSILYTIVCFHGDVYVCIPYVIRLRTFYDIEIYENIHIRMRAHMETTVLF